MKELDENLESQISGGNAVTNLANTFWGKTALSLCRKDVKKALTDEKFTDELLQVVDNPSEIKKKFEKRGVKVSQLEVDFCCKQFKKHCK